MVKQFKLKKLFGDKDIREITQIFGFRKWSHGELSVALEHAFEDYILVALSELGDNAENHQKLYLEAAFHIEKASKLLQGMPHPAGKMSYRLSTMHGTLNKLMEGSLEISAQRANRFMEKNLIRRLRDIWMGNTSTFFHVGSDGSGRNPRDYIIYCLRAAGREYPELTWFNDVDEIIADQLIKNIKR